jgi:hypothetical protein
MTRRVDAEPVHRAPRIIARIIGLTLAIEAFTVVTRYGFGLQSTRDTESTIGVITFGLRIHHGYIGLAMLLVAWIADTRRVRLRRHLIVWGAALVCSDLIHHFLVLWPIEGSPEFHFVYGVPTGR